MSRWPILFLVYVLVSNGLVLVQANPAIGQELWPAQEARSSGRTIVLGFDGMDPKLVSTWMAAGKLPNFSRLAEQGSFQPLPTTNPAQSPVAWASFATGTNPGEHGLFDFLSRNEATYAPEYAVAKTIPGREWKVLGLKIPVTDGAIVNRRIGEPFWVAAESAGLRASVLRVPVTFPPDDISRMLSGMGVPDLLGTQGTFTMYSTRDLEGENARVIKVTPTGGRVETKFEGPGHPLTQDAAPLTVPLVIEDAGRSEVNIELDGSSFRLSVGEWSDWVPLRFSVAWVIGIRAIVRVHLVSAFPDLRLYISPMNLDPRDPVQPISSPSGYSEELAERIGLYHTLGMPEETWSLNEGMISDSAYLDMVRTILAEREAMLHDTLDRHDSNLVVAVFVQTDRVAHMFYRGLDEMHPLHSSASPEARGAIEWIYREADRILGETMRKLAPEDRLIVLSDHGFSSFRRSVHLNRWLVENGYMALKPGQPESESLFSNVDWTRTRAYAIGLNGVYLNLAGRERLGIVGSGQAEALRTELAERLGQFEDPESGAAVINSVAAAADIYQGSEVRTAPDLLIGYDEGYRASWQTTLGGVPAPLIEDNNKNWSGDHCIDPELVPGVLFTSFRLDSDVASIRALPGLIAETFTAGDGGGDAE